MKQFYIKIILSLVVLLAGYLTITLVFDRNPFIKAGELSLIIEDDSGNILYDETLFYEEGTTLFEVLNKNFDLTCATLSYQADTTCETTFNVMGIENHILLGIKSDTFELMSDWQHSFLKLQVFDGTLYVDTTVGFDHLDLNMYDQIKILLDEVR